MRKSVGVCIALVAGVLLPFQASINASLLEPLDNPIGPAMVSFVTGTIWLSFIFCYDPRSPEHRMTTQRVFPLFTTAKWYISLLPGAIGAYYVVLASVLGSKLGFSLFFVSSVSGQLIAAAFTDHVGFMHTTVEKVDKFRIVTILFVVGGCILAAYEKVQSNDSAELPLWKTTVFILVALSSGSILALQVPLNHAMREHMKSLPHRISLWSFFVGSVWLVLATYLSTSLHSVSVFSFHNFRGVFFWQYLGGLLGCIYVTLSIFIAPKLGYSLFFVSAIAGQLCASLFIDAFGWLHSERIEPTVSRIIGILVVFASVLAFRFATAIKSCWRTSEEEEGVAEEKSEHDL